MSDIITKRDAIELSKKHADILPVVEIHVLQSVCGALFNRDFNNRQKIISYGGRTRARFSSASALHDIRFEAESDENIHTRMLPMMIKSALYQQGGVDEKTLKIECDITDSLFSKEKKEKKSTEDAEKKAAKCSTQKMTSQVIDVDQYTLHKYIEAIKTAANNTKDDSKASLAKAKKKVDEIMNTSSTDRPISEVTALYGRMATDQTYSTVYSPLLVSHAFSIDEYANDYDDFTAVDDYLLKTGIVLTDDGVSKNTGSAHMNTSDISANTYYRYAGISQVILFENLCIGKSIEQVPEIIQKTYDCTAHFAKKFITTLPSAKQTRNFAHTMPDAVYIDKGCRIQGITAADRFEKAVTPVANKSICDIGVEHLQKFAYDSVYGAFAYQELSGQYWLSDKYDAPEGLKSASLRDMAEIVRP